MLTLLQVLLLQAEQEEHEPVEDHVQDQAAVVGAAPSGCGGS